MSPLRPAAAPGKTATRLETEHNLGDISRVLVQDPHTCLLTQVNVKAPHCVVPLKSTDHLIVPGSNGD